jgi:hypothetical protein
MRSLVPFLSLAVIGFAATAMPQSSRATASPKSFVAASDECFTLKTYAPKRKLPLHPQGAIEKRYVPQAFALRSTCSKGGRVEMLPSLRWVPLQATPAK